MGDTAFSCIFACCYVLLLPTVIMQGIGCFSTKLLFTDECGDIGLNTECCFSHCNVSSSDYIGPRRLSDVANGLHITAFSVFLLFALFVMWLTCCNCREEYDPNACVYCLGCISLLLLPLAGIFCVAGSIVVQYAGDRPDNSTLGAAFYLTLFTGIYVIVMTILMICCGCFIFSKSDEVKPMTTSQGQRTKASNLSDQNPKVKHTNIDHTSEPVSSQRSPTKKTNASSNVPPLRKKHKNPLAIEYTQPMSSQNPQHQTGIGDNKALALRSPDSYSSELPMPGREHSGEYSLNSESSEDVMDQTYAAGYSEQTDEYAQQSSSQSHYVKKTEASGFRAQAHETGTDVVAARVVDQEEIHEVNGFKIFRKIRTTIITSIREKLS